MLDNGVVMSEEQQQFHIRLRRGEVGRYVLMPGDPGRVPLIAGHLENAEQVASNREYLTYTGTLDGIPVSVMSTGIGAPSTAIAAEELIAIGVDTLIRVGTAGSIANDLRTGDLVVARAAVRDEGTSKAYVPAIFPAIADHVVVTALCEAAETSGNRFRSGIVRSADAFYSDVAPDTIPYHEYPMGIWQESRVLCSEMESAALFVVATLRQVRAGGIMAVVNATEEKIDTGEVVSLSLEPLIETAIEGVRRLIKADSA